MLDFSQNNVVASHQILGGQDWKTSSGACKMQPSHQISARRLSAGTSTRWQRMETDVLCAATDRLFCLTTSSPRPSPARRAGRCWGGQAILTLCSSATTARLSSSSMQSKSASSPQRRQHRQLCPHRRLPLPEAGRHERGTVDQGASGGLHHA